jgi:hypothetical protein
VRKSRKAPDSLAAAGMDRPAAACDGSRPACPEISLAAVRAFCETTRDGFAQAASRQLRNLQGVDDRLSGLTQQLTAVRELKAALALKTEITECLADAADANVQVWADLVQQVQAGCARLRSSLVLNDPPPTAPPLISRRGKDRQGHGKKAGEDGPGA